MAKKKSPKPSPKSSKSQLAAQAAIEKLISDERKNKENEPIKKKPGRNANAIRKKESQALLVRSVLPPPKAPPVLTFLTPKQPATPQPPATVSKPQDPFSAYNPNPSVFCDRRHLDPKLWTTTVQQPKPRAKVVLPYDRGSKSFRFLDLPGELRNKIYDYVIPTKKYYLSWVDGTQRSKALTYKRLPSRDSSRRPVSTRLIDRRPAAKYGKDDPVRRALMQAIYEAFTPVSLLWVCAKMYPEASSVLYSKCTFTLHRLKAIRHFLDRLSFSNRKALASLDLRYQAYGHPAKTVDEPWKLKHDYVWEKICERISRECSVTHLSLDVSLGRCPINFCPLDDAHLGGSFTRWMMPLWQFIDLKHFECIVRSRIKESAVLEVASRELRREVLDDQWDEKLETSTRDAFGREKAKPWRRVKVLTLTT